MLKISLQAYCCTSEATCSCLCHCFLHGLNCTEAENPSLRNFFLTIYSFRRNALPHQHKQTYPTLCHPIYLFTRIVFAQNLLYALPPTQRITENEMLNLVELIKSSTILDKFSCRKELKLYKAISDRERNWHPSVIVTGNYLLG